MSTKKCWRFWRSTGVSFGLKWKKFGESEAGKARRGLGQRGDCGWDPAGRWGEHPKTRPMLHRLHWSGLWHRVTRWDLTSVKVCTWRSFRLRESRSAALKPRMNCLSLSPWCHVWRRPGVVVSSRSASKPLLRRVKIDYELLMLKPEAFTQRIPPTVSW